jgi:hypothetical protein
MGPAPAFDCANCGKQIGKTRTHYVIDRQPWCVRCITKHHRWDHIEAHASRAWLARTLGLWP